MMFRKKSNTLEEYFPKDFFQAYNPYTSIKKQKKSKKIISTTKTKQTKIHTRYTTQQLGQYGNILTPHKTSPTRILYMNVNGICTIENDKTKEITCFMNKYNINICGLSETNVHWNNNTYYRTEINKIRQYLNDSKAYLNTSDTDIPWTQRYKPGGTATISKKIISDQTTHRYNDRPYGRWNTIIIGPTQHQVAIVTAYLVCNTQIIPEKSITAAY